MDFRLSVIRRPTTADDLFSSLFKKPEYINTSKTPTSCCEGSMWWNGSEARSCTHVAYAASAVQGSARSSR
eukprot:69218-Pleurochrysis_carterae.AAC.1